MKIIALLILLISASLSAQSAQEAYFQEQLNHLQYGSTVEVRVLATSYFRAYRSNKRSIRPLLKAFKGYPSASPTTLENDPYLKFSIVQALSEMNATQAIKPFVEYYLANEKNIKETDPIEFTDPEKYTTVMVLGEILRGLGHLSYNADAESLLKKGLTHPHAYIRTGAADGLKGYKRKENLELLKTSLSNEKNENVKTAILGAIVNTQRIADQFFHMYASQLESDDPGIRYRTSNGLAESDIKSGELYLEKALGMEEDPMVRRQLIKDLQILKEFRVPRPKEMHF